jgi:hypothetical protein
MAFDLDSARAIARGLKAIPSRFDDAAVESAAKELMRLCRQQVCAGKLWTREELAAELVFDICRDSVYGVKWAGVPCMVEVFERRFIAGSNPNFTELQEARAKIKPPGLKLVPPPPPPPAEECAKCNCGMVQDPATLLCSFCDCPLGASLRLECPGLVEMNNAQVKARASRFPQRRSTMSASEFAWVASPPSGPPRKKSPPKKTERKKGTG